MTIEGHDVLLVQPDFAQAPKLKGSRVFDQVKLSPAPTINYFRGETAQHVLYFDFVLHGKEAIRELSDFFHDRRGKWGEFLVPSWHPELVLQASVNSHSTEVRIEPVGYAGLLSDGGTSMGNFVFLLHEEGDLHISRVASVTGTSPEVLTLVTETPRSFVADRCIVGFAYFCRFLQDELEMEFDGPEAAKTSLAMTELIRYDAEVVGS